MREFIETAFITFFGILPSDKDYEFWENEEKLGGRTAFMKKLIEYACSSQDRINKGIRIKYNPFVRNL